MPRVAGLIIGHEILTGKFADQNGPFLIERLRALGAELTRLVILEDDVDAIADEVSRWSTACDAVVTTGGVGPTHDDITMEAVAAGLGRPLEVNQELVALMKEWDIAQTPANLRMATLPRGSTLIRGTQSRFPVVRCENVWVFPGVPRLFQRKFAMVEHYFRGEPLISGRIVLGTFETDIAEQLTAIAGEHTAVIIGSYPRFEEPEPTVVLTLESHSQQAWDTAHSALLTAFGALVRQS